jgi:DNA-directed RNA polymerase specialized sigma24 family protein
LISQIEQITSFDHAKALVTLMATRKAISCARTSLAEKRQPPKDPDPLSVENAGNQTEVDRSDLILMLRRALDTLDPLTRLLVVEKVAYGFTYEEISGRHGLPLGTACTKVYQGLKTLRAQLKDSAVLFKELSEYLR